MWNVTLSLVVVLLVQSSASAADKVAAVSKEDSWGHVDPVFRPGDDSEMMMELLPKPKPKAQTKPAATKQAGKRQKPAAARKIVKQ